MRCMAIANSSRFRRPALVISARSQILARISSGRFEFPKKGTASSPKTPHQIVFLCTEGRQIHTSNKPSILLINCQKDLIKTRLISRRNSPVPTLLTRKGLRNRGCKLPRQWRLRTLLMSTKLLRNRRHRRQTRRDAPPGAPPIWSVPRRHPSSRSFVETRRKNLR